MKFFAFIMACVVLALSCMPCADNDSIKQKSESLIITAAQQNDQHEDICSPFCHCTCCAGFSINHFIASISIISQYESNELTCFSPSDIRAIVLPIWQPPQLV